MKFQSVCFRMYTYAPFRNTETILKFRMDSFRMKLTCLHNATYYSSDTVTSNIICINRIVCCSSYDHLLYLVFLSLRIIFVVSTLNILNKSFKLCVTTVRRSILYTSE